MRKVIITDTSCIIQLDLIGELELLNKIYGVVTVTPEIASEYNKQLPEWFEILEPNNKKYQQILENSLDKGEASAIALALEHINSLVVLDELKGRKIAEKLGLKVTGTLGILIEAKQSGHLKSVKDCLNQFRQTRFRISTEVERIILQKSGEL